MENKKNTLEKEKTDFQGPISLDAILAATTGKSAVEPKVEPKKPIVQPKAQEEEEEEIDETVNNKGTDEIDENKNPQQNTTQTPPAAEVVETEAYKTAQRLISLGVLEDFLIQTSDEDTEGTPISEFKGMTDDNLEEIIKIHKEEKNKEISSNYLPKAGLKEHQLKVIQILQNGGDLSQIAETPDKAFKRPFEDYDMDDQKRQIDVRYTDLVHQRGLDHESAITIIDKEIKSGVIAEKAKDIFDSYRKAHADYIDGILEEQKKEKEFKDLNFKENKKALTAKLKESGLKESVYKKVASEYAKKNDNGDYALIDKLREALDKPDENHELILHLTDKDLFNETFKIKAAQESQKAIVRLASGAASKGNKQVQKTTKTEVEAPWIKRAEIYNETIKNN